jgi:tRNA(adenine34) deaminase
MVHARIKRLIYGADDAKAGAVRSAMELLQHPAMNHRMEVCGGVLAGRCAELMQTFFKDRR